MECVTLIDISSEDDLLIPSSSHGLGSKVFSNLVAENTEKVSKQMEQLSELSESPEQKRRRSDRYSLRKSLAWDSEFFTSEGVLNAEELAIINSTYSKAIGLKLPGIHEELRKSAESTSTLDSESRALENLEVHLFENLRASSKRSLVASNQTANMEQSGKAKEQRKPNKPHLRNLKKLDISSQTMVASRNGQSRSSNKSTDISSTPPLRAVHGKSSAPVVNKQIKNNRGMVLPGITAKRQAGPDLNKATNDPGMASRSIPSKDSNLRTPQSRFNLVTASCSSSTRPASSSSDSSSSRLAIMRNSSINTIRSSSNFSNKTPLKTTRSRTGSKNQICISSSGKSTLLLSKISPSSSIDSFLSESSSLTSTSTKHSNSFKGSNGGLTSSPSLPVSTENDASQKSGGAMSQSFTGNHSKITLKLDSDTRGTPLIGLRMPRPRIGFFDKEKTLLHGSNKYLQTSLSCSLAKNSGINVASAANKSKSINPPLMRSGAHPYSLNHTSKSTGRQMVLKPRYDVMENEINGSGLQKINDQSFLMNIQQEQLQSELNDVDATEKENLCPKAYSTVTMLEGMVASLSLSEVKDLISRD